mmetsp:Transcript_1528/g.3255  ORF Transcript_1528/g.3255 Transcript_1528/m.3255 type:complete len:170 (+) Transcript_1528:229-738(+)
MATSNRQRLATPFVFLAITLITFAIRFQLLRHSPSFFPVPDSCPPLLPSKHIRHQRPLSPAVMSVRYQDYVKDDYRAFVFATHPTYGMLLLHCTRKKKKPPHFQAPGGHIDKEDFEAVIARTPGISDQGPALLIQASKIGAARELYEETGIDITSALDRYHLGLCFLCI